ncbi:MAG: hypothetical protein CME65_16095 [Halobacteriovoraceae bacterium]|nr:hypothetical protein [Halobacteriovoraceae bacterium]|tara:strand:+ start:19793 stop:20287 length:495 start_codon:yes stop_codon:yes gene_type:complete
MKLFLSVLMLVGMFTATSNAEAARCRVDLENGRGHVLDTFTGFGYSRHEACREARQDCRRMRRSGYYRARVLNCVERGNRGGRRIVQRSCTARLTGPRGRRTLRTFRGTATGMNERVVQARACENALYQCQSVRSRRGRRGICQIDRTGRGGPVRRGQFGISRL